MIAGFMMAQAGCWTSWIVQYEHANDKFNFGTAAMI